MRKIIACACFLLLSGCLSIGSSAPSKFFSLRSVDASQAEVLSKKSIKIGIEEIKIPTYLDKPQIITRDANTVELNISEDNRWSEPLSSMMQRALANDMALYLPNSLVKARYLGRETFDYLVFVEVERFDGALDDNITLTGWWYVIDKNGNIVITKRIDLEGQTGSSYDAMVMADSLLVNQLAKQIVGNMLKIMK